MFQQLLALGSPLGSLVFVGYLSYFGTVMSAGFSGGLHYRFTNHSNNSVDNSTSGNSLVVIVDNTSLR